MREGRPSATAARVAAYRLGLDREATPFGDAAAEQVLAADVAASLEQEIDPDERVRRYLRLRTAFFDRVVIAALGRGVRQVVTVGAGYDGRALRYGKDEVRWFEVDHPDTQADKLDRLARLGIATGQVTFIGLDLSSGGLVRELPGRGFEPDAAALLLCEGLTSYLEPAVLEGVLADLRVLVSVGTRLALSAGVSSPDPETRRRLAARVGSLGEPIRNSLGADRVGGLLTRTRWRGLEVSERSRRAGFLVAAPEWVPARPPQPPSESKVGRYLERAFHRRGTDRLAGHLETTHGVEVEGLRRLDVGVYRVELADGRRWVARIQPEGRPPEAAEGELALLDRLAEIGFPAERRAAPGPPSLLEGQAVIVTDLVAGRAAPPSAATFAALGGLLGRLHGVAADPARPLRAGGAWHHLGAGGPGAEIAAAASLLEDAAPRLAATERPGLDALLGELAGAETCEGLPEAPIHPDCVPANAIAIDDGLVLVDWSGAGRGPRLWSLAWLLWVAGERGARQLAAAAAGYRRWIQPAPEELAALERALLTRALVLDAWSVATGRARLDEVLRRRARAAAEVPELAALALAALA